MASETRRLLLIDDEEDTVELVRDLLRDADRTWSIDWEAGDAAGLEALREGRHDAVLLDYHLGPRTGLELLAEARAHGRTPPVVLLTGAADGHVDGDALAAHVDDVVPKAHLSSAVLERSLRYALERHRVGEALRESEARLRTRSHVRARQEWVAEFGAQVSERRAVVEAVRDLPAAASADEAAAQILDRLGEIAQSTGMALFHLASEVVVCRAASGSLRARFAPGRPVAASTAQRLRRRAAEAVTVTLPGGTTSRPTGRAAHVQIPLVDPDGAAWGVFLIALEIEAGPSGRRAIARRLPALTEMADLVAVALRPRVRPTETADAGRAELRRIIAERAFVPHLRPIVRIADGTVVAHELLTRFRDGTPPAARFADAQRLGIAAELEIATAAAGIDAVRRLPGDASLFLNVSAALLHDPGAMRRCLACADRPVVLELSESEPVDDYAALRRSLATLGSEVRLAVDDAGSGYASLRHILALRPAFVKLDLSWVRGIDADEARQALVRGVCDFATRIGCEVIAEGIETEAELRTLMDIGVELGQGYLLGRPRPVEAVTGR